MTLVKWIATGLGIACVVLAAVRSIWTFPAGIGAVALLGVVVFEARLYSDALLQVFFAGANLYGWWQWAHARAQAGEVPVATMDGHDRVRWLVGITLGAMLWGAAMHRWTDAAMPWWDAAIASASVAAQLLMARRRIENWWLWIAVDVASVPLYVLKGLYLFAGLYLIYLALAVWGLVSWSGAARARWRAVPA